MKMSSFVSNADVRRMLVSEDRKGASQVNGSYRVRRQAARLDFQP